MLRGLIVTLALLGLTLPAQASELPLEEWLDEPDVKLVAVEFYADWCEPCKKAAPKWEALRKKYAPLGLKLVVVNLSESPGAGKRCTRLPWNPDESICDPELGEKLGVTDLPEAFVWSWQGNMLVDRGKHVDEIERVIRRYLDDNPRVAVVATEGPDRGTNSEPTGDGVKPCFRTIAGHTSPIPPSEGVTSRRVVTEVDEEQTSPPSQAAWQLKGGARSLTTPG